MNPNLRRFDKGRSAHCHFKPVGLIIHNIFEYHIRRFNGINSDVRRFNVSRMKRDYLVRKIQPLQESGDLLLVFMIVLRRLIVSLVTAVFCYMV